MTRPELHVRPTADRLAAKPRKVFLDAIAWRAAHPEQKQLVALAQRMRAFEGAEPVETAEPQRRHSA